MTRKILKCAGLLFALVALAVVGRPAWHLADVWWRDPVAALSPTSPGRSDESRLTAIASAEVITIPDDPAAAEAQLAALVLRARSEHRKIAISGARHSMGGHTQRDGALVVDMLSFRQLTLDADHRILTAGAGARWFEIIPLLDHHGLAVAVMQSNNDFTVGGSISVNCHGWQHATPPIASTVDSFRLLRDDGQIVRCSREENAELFSAVLGGYGLFGIILTVDLRVVPNEFYRAQRTQTTPTNYAARYRELTEDAPDIGLAYGRISVAPDHFLEEAMIILLRRPPDTSATATTDTLSGESPALIKRLVFRGSVGSAYGKNLRWRLEKYFGETGNALLSRNEIMNEPSAWFANRDPADTDILHEYFVPPAHLGEFIAVIRPILQEHQPDLLNITVRHVAADTDAMLNYAREEVFGVVMLFHQARTSAADTAMRDLTRDLIGAALASGGTYYLPYRPHATREQFHEAYPTAEAFFALKRRYDSDEIFQNEFYRNYALPSESATPDP